MEYTPNQCTICKAHKVEVVEAFDFYQVRCLDKFCGCRGPRSSTREQAITFWNQRTKAVNCHDDLREACKAFVNEFGTTDEEEYRVFEQAVAAIAKAEE